MTYRDIDEELSQLRAIANANDLTVNHDGDNVNVKFEKSNCFCGSMNLTQGIGLICAVELFFSVVLLLQAPDVLRVEGRYFYFEETFLQSGLYLFLVELVVLVSCIATILLLYIGHRRMQARLVIPHIIWQIMFIGFAMGISAMFLRLTLTKRMLVPSSVVMLILFSIPAILEMWWAFEMIRFYKQLRTNELINRRLRRRSQQVLRNAFANGLLQFQKFNDPLFVTSL
uniref:RGS domain-containing protein n=1 Tax=Steinernema glaseri TaxID=37863 RepID=A0A1I7ZQE1_9BILA